MKKFVMGLIIGAGFMFSMSVNAEGVANFVGKTIQGQFPVKVNGETIDNPGIVIDGVSYLPTRTIAEIAGFEVKFNSESGIELNKEEPTTMSMVEEVSKVETIPTPTATEVDENIVVDTVNIEEQIKGIEAMIEHYNVSIYMTEEMIEKASDEAAKEKLRADIELQREEIRRLEAEKAELEAQLTAQ